jgi:hypothetical protein
MSRPYLVKDIYVNAQKRILVDVSGNPIASAMVPEFFREEEILLRFHVVDDYNQPWVFNETDAFEFGADPDFDAATAVDLLSEDDQFNLPGDWTEGSAEVTDPSQGLICCRVNTNTAEFNAALGTESELNSGCYLKVCTDLVNQVWATVFDGECIYRNIRRTNSSIPTEVTGPEYLTAAQTEALLDADTPVAEKSLPLAGADRLTLWDSAAGLVRKYVSIQGLFADLETAFDMEHLWERVDHNEADLRTLMYVDGLVEATGVTPGTVYRQSDDGTTWIVADPDDLVCATRRLWIALETGTGTIEMHSQAMANGSYFGYGLVGAVGDLVYLDDGGQPTMTVPSTTPVADRVGRAIGYLCPNGDLRFDGHRSGVVYSGSAS